MCLLICNTVPSFNSSTKCLDSPGIMHDRTPDWRVSWACDHRFLTSLLTVVWFASYVCHWCAWLIFFWYVINSCLYNVALADFRSTGVGIKCLYCIRDKTGVAHSAIITIFQFDQCQCMYISLLTTIKHREIYIERNKFWRKQKRHQITNTDILSF